MNGEQLEFFELDAPAVDVKDSEEFTTRIAANAPKDPYRDYNARLMATAELRDHGYLPKVMDVSVEDEVTEPAPEEPEVCDPEVVAYWLNEARATLLRAREERVKRERTRQVARRLLY